MSVLLFVCTPQPCLSVPPEIRNPHGFFDIRSRVLNDTSMERPSWVLFIRIELKILFTHLGALAPPPLSKISEGFFEVRFRVLNDIPMEKSWWGLHLIRSQNFLFVFLEALAPPSPFPKFLMASSVSGLHWWMIHQWKGLEYYIGINTKNFFTFLGVLVPPSQNFWKLLKNVILYYITNLWGQGVWLADWEEN